MSANNMTSALQALASFAALGYLVRALSCRREPTHKEVSQYKEKKVMNRLLVFAFALIAVALFVTAPAEAICDPEACSTQCRITVCSGCSGLTACFPFAECQSGVCLCSGQCVNSTCNPFECRSWNPSFCCVTDGPSGSSVCQECFEPVVAPEKAEPLLQIAWDGSGVDPWWLTTLRGVS